MNNSTNLTLNECTFNNIFDDRTFEEKCVALEDSCALV